MGASGTVRDEQFHEGNGGGRVVHVCMCAIYKCMHTEKVDRVQTN